MKRVLFLADLNPNKLGSMEEFGLFLSEELHKRGDVCYLGFVAFPQEDLKRRFETAGAKIIVFREANSLLSSLQKMISLYTFIQKAKIDIVHVNFSGLTDIDIIGVHFSTAKIIFTDHNSGVLAKRNNVKKVLLRLVHFLLFYRVSRFIAVSDFVRDRLRHSNYVKNEKCITIYNGINLQRFNPSEKILARNMLRFPLSCTIVCSVAMHIPEKGIHFLLQALAILVHKNGVKDITAIIVGEGWYTDELKAMTEKLNLSNHVQYLGRRSDVQTIIAASDMVVVPSVWEEAFGLIIAEAMASERPVVASRIGGIPELIDHGHTGVLFEPGNIDALAQAIFVLLKNPTYRQSLAKAALAKAHERFDISQQITKLIDIYETVELS